MTKMMLKILKMQLPRTMTQTMQKIFIQIMKKKMHPIKVKIIHQVKISTIEIQREIRPEKMNQLMKTQMDQ